MPIQPVSTTNKSLFENAPKTFISSAATAGGSTITVENIQAITTNAILCIEDVGNDNAEIIHTHASTAPSGSTVTLASNLKFTHNIGTSVYVIEYDNIELSNAVTITGTKNVISTSAIDPTSVDTIIKDSTYGSGYYFVRYKNTISSAFSSYSDPVPYVGWSEMQVARVIEYALQRNAQEDFSKNVNFDFCIQEINACLKIIRGQLTKWHSLQTFDYSLGTPQRGEYVFPLPLDAWKYSYKSVLSVHLAGGDNLTYRDKKEFDSLMYNTYHSNTNGTASIGDTTLTLDNVSDFPTSGNVFIKGAIISYTGVDTSLNQLTGIPASGDGSIATAIADGVDVWSGLYREGIVQIYTVYDGNLYFWPMCDATYAGKNLYLNYWKEAPSVDSAADEIDILRFDMVKFWLTWAVRSQLMNNYGQRDIKDQDYQTFLQLLGNAVSIELKNSGQKFKTHPGLNKIY